MRQPRGLVKVNGQIAQGWVEWEVTNNTLYHADKFSVALSLRKQSQDMGWSWWAAQTQLTFEIFAGFPADVTNYDSNDLTSLILGNADSIEIDPLFGIIRVEGRDKTALLIDTKTAQKWINQTSSQIATQLAQAQGLTPKVTATKTKAGNYYAQDHVLPTHERSQWDLLTYLAQKEGFQVYVTGNTLVFGPAPPDAAPYIIQWQEPNPVLPASNAVRLNFSHNLTLSRDIVVRVRSWNMWQKASYTKTATVKHKSRNSGDTPQVYSFIKPGLTPEQAQQLANQTALSLAQHELHMHVELPGDITPTMQSVLQLRGTPYDQTFYPETIVRSMRLGGEGEDDDTGGFRMSIESKNVRPMTEVLV